MTLPLANRTALISSLLYMDMDMDNISSTMSNSTFAGGLERDPLSTVIPMTVLYALILITGVIGNVSTCVVIARNKYMRTATNYYLFSLAISDLLLLILGLPQEMYQLWWPYPYIFGEVFCVMRGLTSETSTNASVLTITAFTFERFLAICYPLKAHTMSKLSRVVKLVMGIWVLAGLGAVPLALQFGLDFARDESGEEIENTAQCTLKRPIQRSFEISTVIFFVLPMTIILVLYLLIGIQLRRSESLSRRRQAAEYCSHHRQCSIEEKVGEPEVPVRHSTSASLTSKEGGKVAGKGNGTGSGKGQSPYAKFKSRRSWEGRHSALHGRPPSFQNANTSSRRAVIKMLSELKQLINHFKAFLTSLTSNL